MTLVLHSARVLGAGADGRDDGWLRIQRGTIAGHGTGDSWREALPADAEVVDARGLAGPGALLTPGLVDIHNHGGGGRSHGDDAGASRAIARLHAAHGTTRQVASLVSAPIGVLEQQLEAVREAQRSTPGLLGAHLEGPFLQPARRGAHDPAALIDPSDALLERLLAPGGVVQITIAPELPGGLRAVARARELGAVVALGHSDADHALAAAAFDAGASLVTHAFNAMPPLHHRQPGLLGAALDDPRVTLEAIPDGVHLHPAVLATLLRAAPSRVALVTDAMAAAGCADGAWTLGGLAVRVDAGRATLDDGTIAGSTITLAEGVRRAVAAGVSLAAAVEAATATPARAIGMPELGSFAAGAVGDAVLWSGDLAVRAVWQAGERLPAA